MTSPSLCSLDWDDSQLPAWGTAKDARVVVAVETGGSWGRDAVADSGLQTAGGAALYLVRSPGRHAATPERRTVIVSGGFGDEPWLVAGRLTDAELNTFLSFDPASSQTWSRFGLHAHKGPMLLVCTNGRRDACCAVRGRPVAQAAHAAAPGRVWEVSHIGGHRFAPTAIHLPSGQTFGRLTEDDAVALVTAAETVRGGLFTRAKHRGRVDLSPVERVAETWWREDANENSLTPVRLGETDGSVVTLPDGRRVEVTSVPGPELRDSCVKNPKRSEFFEARPPGRSA